eukprot:CAMPEP_0174944726 /NCGR_PEP_ID=MMETSP1355-20121228/79819_1 /TAXON_ID=464990 /ORGANISM="Hemiselmis tepida, Strain CCMP443" /LENGTH=105 /DNA_ID=CAMNT_0016192047 /DNA_START=16 /DNA_END=330 /DNA_ORIENTATION=+
MGVPVIQGYGMTENFAAAVIQPFGFTRVGSIGAPIPCTEVKLQDTDDYKSSDTYPTTAQEFSQSPTFKGTFNPLLAGKVVPRGEVLLRGRNVFVGYFKMKRETQQ